MFGNTGSKFFSVFNLSRWTLHIVLIFFIGCGQPQDPNAATQVEDPQTKANRLNPAPSANSNPVNYFPGGVGSGPSTTAGQLTFSSIGRNILQPRCMSCHGSLTYQGLISNGIVVPGKPESSPLCMAVYSGKMPKGGPKLSTQEISTICNWIKNGAPQ